MMVRLLLCILGLCSVSTSCAGQSVALSTRAVCGTTVNVITVNLNDSKIRVVPGLAAGWTPGGYTDESFSSMMTRLRPVAAINGTFFDKYTLKPVGSIVHEGKLVHSGGIGTAFCLKSDRAVEFRRVSGTIGTHVDWTGVQTALCCGPTLLIDGKTVIDPASEGFRDPHVYARANRSALGVTTNKKLLLVTMPRGVTLENEAKVMKALGCVDAINLDGGASSAMYYKGKYVNAAGRKLTNVLLVYDNGKYPSDKMQYASIPCRPRGPSAVPPRSEASAAQDEQMEAIKAIQTQTEHYRKIMYRYKDRPIDIARYPGARWDDAMATEDGSWIGGAKTSDPFQEVLEFYRAEAKRLGWTGESTSSNVDGARYAVWEFERETGTTELMLVEQTNGDKTEVVISVNGFK